MKLAGNSLKGRANHDGTVSFTCDDCGETHTFGNKRILPALVAIDARSWSITKRKQRCPGCTVIAREKGWVK